MGVAVHDSNLHAKQASGLELRRHIEVSRNFKKKEEKTCGF